MGRRQKVKSASKNRKLKRKERDLKRRSRDIDQVHEDLIKGKRDVALDEDLPGKGQYYCTVCARYFISEEAMQSHMRTKTHKRRSVVAQEVPWTQAESELASR